jgi:hypothetical protein
VRLLPLAAAVALAAVAAPAAGARDVDVAASLGEQVARVATRTDVPVRLPARLALDYDGRLYASGAARPGSWVLALAGAPRCGANACFLASFTGERGGRLAFRRRVPLARGIVGAYKPLACGASCSPPEIRWRQGGALYAIQAKVGVAGAARQRAALVRAANAAIVAAPR